MKKVDIDNKIDSAMNSLDGLEKATPGPFFFTRVQARLYREKKSSWDLLTSYMSRPAIAFAGLCLIVLVNVLVVTRQKTTVQSSVFAEQSDQSSVEDYSVASNSFIYEENSDLP